MKIAHFISNLVFSFISLLFIYIVYTDCFGTALSLGFVSSFMSTAAGKIFSEYNILGLICIYAICILFIVLTVILFIKNLMKKQNVTTSVLSLIGIISTVAFCALNGGLNPTPFKILCVFAAVIVIVQLIVSLIDTVKSYSIEASE